MGRAQGDPAVGPPVLAGGGWVWQAFRATVECAWHCRLGAVPGCAEEKAGEEEKQKKDNKNNKENSFSFHSPACLLQR